MPDLSAPDADKTTTRSRPAGRILGGVLGIAGAAALVLAAIALPPASASDAVGVSVSPVPVDQQRSCAGPAVRLGGGADGSATAITAFGRPDFTAGTPTALGAGIIALANIDVPSSESGATPVSLAAPSAGAPDALLAAAQTETVATADVAGLAAAACVEGASTSWLLAGATDTGRSTMLLLTNESAVSATVDLALYTGEGPVAAPGLTSIAVPPAAQRTISLAGYAPGQAQLAVGVSSRGGLISAALQQSIVRGLEPGGLDLVGATAPAASELTIPGLRITTAVAVLAIPSMP